MITKTKCKNFSFIIIKWRNCNQKSTAPSIRELMKLHKEHNPIRPTVYWQNAPAYKLPKFMTKVLKTHAPLPYSFNNRNTIQLLQDLQ